MPDGTNPEVSEATQADNALREAVGPVLGRIPSGVAVVTAGNGAGQETGMLASWVQQASFDQPMITLAVNRKRYLNDWLAQQPHVVVNLLGTSDRNLLKQFAAGFEPDEPAFEGLNIRRERTGLPILTDAFGYLEGVVRGQMTTGDHTIYAVEIIAGGSGATAADDQPHVHIRKNGFNY